MSIASLVEEMVAAGATPQLIAIAVRAVEERDDAERARRAKRAEQKAKERAMSRDSRATVAMMSHDINATVAIDPSPEKELSPTPPIEKQTPSYPSLRSGSPPTREAKRPRRLTMGFGPTARMREVGRERGLSEAEIDDEGEKIRDWSINSKNGAKIDWEAAWRNWLKGRSPSARAGPSSSSRPPSALAILHGIANGTDKPKPDDTFADWNRAGSDSRTIEGHAVEVPQRNGTG